MELNVPADNCVFFFSILISLHIGRQISGQDRFFSEKITCGYCC